MSDLVLEDHIASKDAEGSSWSTYIIAGCIIGGIFYACYYGRISRFKFEIGKFEVYVDSDSDIQYNEIKINDDNGKVCFNFTSKDNELMDNMKKADKEKSIESVKRLINLEFLNIVENLNNILSGNYDGRSYYIMGLDFFNHIYLEGNKIESGSLMKFANIVNKTSRLYDGLCDIFDKECKSSVKQMRESFEKFVNIEKFGDNIVAYTFEEYIGVVYESQDNSNSYLLKRDLSKTAKDVVSDFCINKYNEVLNVIRENKNIDLDKEIISRDSWSFKDNLVVNVNYCLDGSVDEKYAIRSALHFNDLKFDMNAFCNDIKNMVEYFVLFKELLNNEAIERLDDLLRMCGEYDNHINELEYKDQKVCLYEYRLGDVIKCEIYVLGKSGDTNYRTVISRGKYSSIDDFKKNSGSELFTFIAGYFCESVLLFECNEIVKKCDITGLYDNQSILQRVLKDLAKEKARKGSEAIFVVESILSSVGYSRFFAGVISLINPISIYDIGCRVICRNPSVEIMGNNYKNICDTLSAVLEEVFNEYWEYCENTKSPDASSTSRSSDEYNKMLDEWIRNINNDIAPTILDFTPTYKPRKYQDLGELGQLD